MSVMTSSSASFNETQRKNKKKDFNTIDQVVLRSYLTELTKENHHQNVQHH